MRRLNSNLASKPNDDDHKTPYLEIIIVGAIQFLLAILLYCYGVFLMQLILNESRNLKTTLWTAVSFVAANKITNPWTNSYCKHLENSKRKVYKRNICISVSVLCGCLVFIYFQNAMECIIIFYGICGGTLSSIIHVHLKFATAESFKHNVQIFNIMDQITKASSLLLTPHLILFFTKLYGVSSTFLIVTGLILNILPLCLLLKTKKTRKKQLCKFRTFDELSIEMNNLTPKPLIKESSISSSSDEDSGDEEQQDEILTVKKEPINCEEYKSEKPAPLTLDSLQAYYKHVGVNILPDIPEESDLEEDEDINEINSKRLSRISAILQEINENSHKPVNLSVTNLYQPDECDQQEEIETIISNQQNTFEKVNHFNFKNAFSRVCDINLKKRRLKQFIQKHCIRTSRRVLKKPFFYPALIANVIITFLSTIIFATTPYLMFFVNEWKNRDYPNTAEESTFLLTIVGFSWLFFLSGYPIFNKLSKLKTKIFFLTGLTILGASLFIVHKFSYDNFVLFSLTFGLGHGIVNYAEKTANRDFFGETDWKMIEGTLEILSGFFVILVYISIYLSSLDIYTLISNAYWLYLCIIVLWITVYLTKIFKYNCRNRGRYNVQKLQLNF